MIISLELKQSWGTTGELLEYLEKLSRTMQRICEMEAETPTDWFIEVEPIGQTREEYIIRLTHL